MRQAAAVFKGDMVCHHRVAQIAVGEGMAEHGVGAHTVLPDGKGVARAEGVENVSSVDNTGGKNEFLVLAVAEVVFSNQKFEGVAGFGVKKGVVKTLGT